MGVTHIGGSRGNCCNNGADFVCVEKKEEGTKATKQAIHKRNKEDGTSHNEGVSQEEKGPRWSVAMGGCERITIQSKEIGAGKGSNAGPP